MSDFAYHMEAQRKARIIEKKNKAQSSNGNRQVSDCNQHGGGSASPQKYNTQRYTDRPVRIEQGAGYDEISLPNNARQSSAHVQSGIYRDLRGQQKTLRDHNLVMGPMTAFKEYFDTKNYNPHRSTMTHY